MVMFYCKQVSDKKMTINQVPSKWRAEVASRLGITLGE